MASSTFYAQQAANRRRSLLLMFVVVLLLAVLGFAIGFGFSGDPIIGVAITAGAAAFALTLSLGSYFEGDKIVLAASSARRVEEGEHPQLMNVVRELSLAAGVPMPAVYTIDDSAPNAFATGRNPEHASIAITTGLLDQLDREELQGVVGHELSHVRNLDIRFALLMGVLVGTIVLLADWALRYAFYFGGGRSRRGKGNGLQAILLVVGIVLHEQSAASASTSPTPAPSSSPATPPDSSARSPRSPATRRCSRSRTARRSTSTSSTRSRSSRSARRASSRPTPRSSTASTASAASTPLARSPPSTRCWSTRLCHQLPSAGAKCYNPRRRFPIDWLTNVGANLVGGFVAGIAAAIALAWWDRRRWRPTLTFEIASPASSVASTARALREALPTLESSDLKELSEPLSERIATLEAALQRIPPAIRGSEQQHAVALMKLRARVIPIMVSGDLEDKMIREFLEITLTDIEEGAQALASAQSVPLLFRGRDLLRRYLVRRLPDRNED